MGKTVIVTEKPSVGRTYAQILGVSDKKDGYMENNDYIITWCFGHLVEMSYPQAYDEKYKKWNIDGLPFLPGQYRYEPIQSSRDQLMIIKGLYHRSDVSRILYAGDSGREGIYIQMLVRNQVGVRNGVEERVVWISSQTEDEIRRGIREAKPLQEFAKLTDAAYMRAIEDYAMGINFSRALTCKFGRTFNEKAGFAKTHPIPVGRVMTCVLGMVVDRENEIKNFKSTDYYKVKADLSANGGTLELEWKPAEGAYKGSPLLYEDKGFLDQKEAEKFIAGLGSQLQVKDVKKEEKKKNAPYLFNLAELQSECSKLFKISPNETLAIAQTLYERELTTYPRTDARVLTSAVAGEIQKNLSALSQHDGEIGGWSKKILDNGWHRGLARTKYVDDAKVTDHYAIIPTDTRKGTDGLSDQELAVYELICRRFLAVFYPPAIYEEYVVDGVAGNEVFRSTAKVLKQEGFLKVAGDAQKGTDPGKAQAIAGIQKGGTYPCAFRPATSTTQPPKRYTTGSMVLAMENAGSLIEDEELRAQIKGCGIGTSATRAEVINKLITNEHLKLDKKTQVITPATAGYVIYGIVKDSLPDFLSPKMTASWEKGLSQVESGEVTRGKYQQILNVYIEKKITAIKAMEGDKPFEAAPLDGVSCPNCGGKILLQRFGYACENYKGKDKGGCLLAFGTVGGYRITEDDVRQLLKNGRTGQKDNAFLSKEKNKRYTASLVLATDEDGQRRLKLEFPDYSKPQPTGYTCPNCGKQLTTLNWKYQCKCGFSMATGMAKHTFTDSEVKKLLTDGETGTIKSFKKKDGTKFSAKAKRDKSGELSFSFDGVRSAKAKK